MVELSIIRDCVAIFGVIAGFSYYVLTVQATRRNQQLQLDARQAMLINQVYSWFLDTESLVEYMEMLNWEWTDYGDFEKKYGSDNDVLKYAKRTRIWASLDLSGKLLREGLVDINFIFDLRSIAFFQWFKFKNIIEEQRKRYYTSSYMANWEYLVDEVMKHGEKIGDPWTPPVTLSKYVSDQKPNP